MYYNASLGQYGAQRGGLASNSLQKLQRGGPAYQKNNGYQLKVGGVVVGSWANGARNAQLAKMNRNGMVRVQLKAYSFVECSLIFFILSLDSLSCQSTNTSWYKYSLQGTWSEWIQRKSSAEIWQTTEEAKTEERSQEVCRR